VLWTQALRLRQDLAALREQAPGLAAVLEKSRAVLDTSAVGVIGALDVAGDIDQGQAGHVLATLWSISDPAAPAMADITYAHPRHPDPDHPHDTDRPQAARAAYALHHAIARLRKTYPRYPLLWAPCVHLGP
jgi:hypothetical protein